MIKIPFKVGFQNNNTFFGGENRKNNEKWSERLGR